MNKFAISRVTWIIVGSAIMFTLICIWFFKSFNKVPVEIPLGYSSEAKRNPFLAAEKFLQKVSIKFESRSDFGLFDELSARDDTSGEQNDSFLGEFDTVLINGSRIGMSTLRRENMKRWIENGGHLVLVATELYEYEFESSRDKFLDEVGLRYYETGSDYDYYEDEGNLTLLNFEDAEQPTEIHFHGTGYIEDTSGDASFIAGPQDVDQFIQYPMGEGLLTVVIDFSIFRNGRIRQHDHAMFLAQLIGNSPKAWLVYNREQPSLLSMMIQHGPLMLISSLALLFLILIGQLWRRGPAKQDTPPVQREIMQHIAAAGEFSFRTDQGNRLLHDLMESIHNRMGQLVFGYQRLTPQKQIIKLSHITGIDKNELAGLWQIENENQDTFVQKVQLIQEIRKHL
ncbi:hypothetical protein FLL45_19435 [Aliikangiella marina]|uniref:DUF4350 domain-containing protein n=1 Tax=Aliikangiella marina TaxID=1712262 RepID=A0A545T589_9GAMM|nr:DUF4350 domain-containing protein [Aliikangiella marina]TQV72386.1 hypothetical protein FLL45_19435 [Aliikangiella marina]